MDKQTIEEEPSCNLLNHKAFDSPNKMKNENEFYEPVRKGYIDSFWGEKGHVELKVSSETAYLSETNTPSPFLRKNTREKRVQAASFLSIESKLNYFLSFIQMTATCVDLGYTDMRLNNKILEGIYCILSVSTSDAQNVDQN